MMMVMVMENSTQSQPAQMMMNAQQALITVMRMLLVLTPVGHLLVPATMDTQEMVLQVALDVLLLYALHPALQTAPIAVLFLLPLVLPVPSHVMPVSLQMAQL
jgi:hypothetical protein